MQFRFVHEAHGTLGIELANGQPPLRICEALPVKPDDPNVVAVGTGLAVILDLGDSHRCYIAAVHGNRVPARFDWPATTSPRLRAQGDKHLLAFDASGRILHIALETSIARHISLR